MHNQPRFSSKTKIIGGKLVTVYGHDQLQDGDRGVRGLANDYSHMRIQEQQKHQQFRRQQEEQQQQLAHLAVLQNNRLEAQRNNARAIEQTYTSVLSPLPSRQRGAGEDAEIRAGFSTNPRDQFEHGKRPSPDEHVEPNSWMPPSKSMYEMRYKNHAPSQSRSSRSAETGDTWTQYSNQYVPVHNLESHVLSAISSCSRYQLLSVLSAMRRRDPNESGVLYKADVEDVMNLSGVAFEDVNVIECLLGKYEVSPLATDYRRMWKFVMDCYANKSKITSLDYDGYNSNYNISNSSNSRDMTSTFSVKEESVHSTNKLESGNDRRKSCPKISPGLKAELEFGLRHHARSNDRCLDLEELRSQLVDLDPYGTGKVLQRDALRICQYHLPSVNANVVSACVGMCDTDRSGLVDYKGLLALLEASQPTYLPPINQPPPTLTKQSTQDMIRSDVGANQRYHTSYKEHCPAEDLNNNNCKEPYSNEKLEKVGALGLDLNEFETKIHTRKTPPPTPTKLTRPTTYRKEKCDHENTYTLLNQPPPSIETLISGNNQGLTGTMQENNNDSVKETPNDPTLSGVEQFAVNPMITPETKNKRSNRKQWQKSNNSSFTGSPVTNLMSPQKASTSNVEDAMVLSQSSSEKWWKLEAESSEGNTTPNEDEHKTWVQSSRIQKIKGKRRRKKKTMDPAKSKAKLPKAGIECESNTELEKTDMDSEFYTTTDFEVEEPSIVCKPKTFYATPIKNVEGAGDEHPVKNADDEKDDRGGTGNNILNSAPGAAKLVRPSTYHKDRCDNANTYLLLQPQTTTGEMVKEVVPSVTTDIETEYQKVGDEDADTARSEEEEGGNKEAKEEKRLEVECLTPPPKVTEDVATIENEGKSFTVYPSHDTKKTYEKHETPVNMKLYLEHVYGCCTGNLRCVSSGEFLFHVGNIVVLMNVETRMQRFFKKHDAVVTSMTVHPDAVTVASVQRKSDKKCVVYVWNCVDLSVTSSIHITNSNVSQVSSMDFSTESRKRSFLGTIQNSTDHQIVAIYDWKEASLLFNATTSCVTGLLFCNVASCSLITYGKQGHVIFYTVKDDELVAAEGKFGDMEVAKNIGCAVINKTGNLVTGDTNGTIYLWSNELRRIDHCIQNAHRGPISTMVYTSQGYLLTGCTKDQVVASWDAQLKVCDKITLPGSSGVRALCTYQSNLYVASLSNTLYKVVLNTDGNPLTVAQDNIFSVSEGHPDIVNGIAAHPTYTEMVATVCSDGTVQMYNIDSKSVAWLTNVKGNGSCLSFHPHHEYVVVGCQDGSVHLISSTTGEFVDKFKHSSSAVSVVCFSPDGNYLACGVLDGHLIVYSFDAGSQELELSLRDKVSSEKIQFIDWTASSSLLRLQSRNEIMYYDFQSRGAGANSADMSWSTSRCSISYEMCWAWSSNDITRSPLQMNFDVAYKRKLLVLASSGLLYMLNYPWISEQSSSVSTPNCYQGAQPILRVSADGSKLFVAFDDGGTLWQWKIL